MKIDVDEMSPIQRKVRVALPADAVAKEFSRAYKNLGQRVRVKGFRAGKIPRSVLQGIYGDDVKSEVRSHLVEESLGAVIKDRGLQIVSRPEVETQDLREDGEFSFSAVFEVKPEIELKDYLGVEVEKPRVAITDAQVDDSLKRLQESHASLVPVDDRNFVQKNDFVTLDFEGTIAGKPFEGSKGENYTIEVGAGNALPQFEEAVMNLKVGDARVVQVPYPETYPNKEIAGKSVDFSITVREIKQKVFPNLDDEFAKDHGEHGSLQELKAAIRKRLEEELSRYQEEQLKEQLLGRLIEAHSFAIPPSMVERQTRYLMERFQTQSSDVTGEDGDDTSPPQEEARKRLENRAMRQVQATLLVERIAQREKIDVDDKALQDRIENVARAAGDRARTVREHYSRPDARDDLRAQLVFDQTLNFLLGRAIVKEVDPVPSKVDEESEKR
jgi:trigger factor